LTLRNADRVVTVTRAFAPALLRHGVMPERLCIIQNALGPVTTPKQWQRNTARQALLLSDAPAVLYVGRLSLEKGVADLLRAFALLTKAPREPHTLLIVGDGPERQRLEVLAQKLNILESTRFFGYVTDPSIFYSAANVLAIPSLSEGMPFTLMEGLAAGLPVVATAVGGIPQVVSHGMSAILVPAGNPEAMASGLAALLNDPHLVARLVAAGKQKVAEFAPEIRADRLLRLFSAVIEQRKTGLQAGA